MMPLLYFHELQKGTVVRRGILTVSHSASVCFGIIFEMRKKCNRLTIKLAFNQQCRLGL